MADINDAEVIARQWVAIQRAGTDVGKTQEAMLKELFIIIRREYPESRATITQIANAVSALAQDMSRIAYTQLQSDLTKMAQLVAAGAHEQVAAIGVKSKAPNISTSKMNKWMTATPMASSPTTIKDLHVASYDSVARQARSIVLLQQTADNSPSAVRSSLKALETQMMRRVMTNAVTGSNMVSNLSKNQEYAKASRYADRVMWLSTLDARTSDFCMVADGKVFPIDEGPRPPAHPNCRSTIILVGKDESIADVQNGLTPRPAVEAKSKEALDRQGLRTAPSAANPSGRPRGPSISDRSPLKGTQTNATTYEGWLKDQPKYYQEAILGKSATAEFRSGKSLSAVLKNRNSAINFESLEEALN